MQLTLLFSVLSLYAGVASATEVMRRPANFRSKLKPNTPIHSNPYGRLSAGKASAVESGGKVNIGYFTNWGIYGAGYTPNKVDIDSLTHIYYAFADTDPKNGRAFLSDVWADQQIPYPGDDTNAPGKNLYGNFKQLYLLKQKKRSLKTILSFGGWTYSQDGHFNFATNSASRANFVKTSVQLLEDNGFDGIDIDWEYPAAGAQADAFVALLKETRAALDTLAKTKGDTIPYQLSAAVPAGPQSQSLKIKEMDKYLTYWNLMAYDYAGAWSKVSDYQANVYGGAYTGVSTNASTEWYLRNGANKNKFVIGMPIYGRGFQKTNGIFQPFDGVGSGTWESGFYNYNVLPFANATVYTDFKNISSYSYDPVKRELISYDTPEIIKEKSNWLIGQGFAGAMFWELSGDKNGTDSLVWTAAKTMGRLDNTENHLNYPGSQFDNVKAGMKPASKHGHKVRTNRTPEAALPLKALVPFPFTRPMQVTMAHALFDIPEIILLVFKILDRSSLLMLLTVSRRFFDVAASLVWENVNHSNIQRILMGLPDIGYAGDMSAETAQNLELTQFLGRWCMYAPHIVRFARKFDDETFNHEWGTLSSTTRRPLLPNLQVLEFTAPEHRAMNALEFATQLGKDLGPTVTSVYHCRDMVDYLDLPSASELSRIIFQCCPNLHTLQLFTCDRKAYAGPITDFVNPLRNFNKLRTLGLGVIVWEPGVLELLGSLPRLESLTAIGQGWGSWQSRVEAINLPPGNFPVLGHLGIGCHLDEIDLVSRVWTMPVLVQQLTSVSLGLVDGRHTRDGYNDNMRDLICSICRASPDIRDLHISYKGAHIQSYLPPEVCIALQQVPLRHVTITVQYTSSLVDTFDFEQLALALPNVEFLLLDIPKHRLSLKDLKLIARHMKKLQHLVAGLHPSNWELGPDWSPSSSPLYLDATSRAFYLKDQETQQVAKCLHKLWPKGVLCAVQCSVRLSLKKYETTWIRLNSAITQIRASEGLNGAVVMSGSSGEYINQDTTPALYRYFQDMKDYAPEKDGFE